MLNTSTTENHSRGTVLARERAHFDRHTRYILHFLEHDRNKTQRWMIQQILKTWDRQLALLNPSLFVDKRVLEVGCGNPRLVFHAKHLGATRAIGLDLSPKFVALGMQRPFTYAGGRVLPVDPDSIELYYGDFMTLPNNDFQVDTLTCFQSLHHFDLDEFVTTAKKFLVPGGHIVISDPVGNHPLRRLGDFVGRFSGLMSPDEQANAPDETIACFTKHGFRLVQCHSLNPTLEIFFHLTELITPLSGELSFWAKLPMALFRPLESWLESKVLSRWPRWGWRYLLVMQKNPSPED